MPELLARLIVLGVGAGIAVGIGLAATRAKRASQPRAQVDVVETDAAVVAFTSTDCDNCARVMAALRGLGVTVREVAHEREPALFEAAGVEAVPLVVVVRPGGGFASQFAGRVRRSRLRRALADAGW